MCNMMLFHTQVSSKQMKNSFGKAVLPKYNFDKADLIVSFGADFLGTWISGGRIYCAIRI